MRPPADEEAELVPNLFDALAPAGRSAPASDLAAVRDYGHARPGLIPLWAGEGDLPTPDFIMRPAMDALARGETFYTYQNGIPELREALARYHTRTFGRASTQDEFVVMGSGMQAIQLAIQATTGPGKECVYFSPAWPNFAAALTIAGGTPVPVRLDFAQNGWSLDFDRVEKAITPNTTALFVNTPSNPTGWTASEDDLRRLLALARRHGLWIIADEIYSLFHWNNGRAASFMDIMDDDDRIIFVNTFSKNWAMTGWRIGWTKTHPAVSKALHALVQYSTSGVPQFLQRGAVAALEDGDGFVVSQVKRAEEARRIVCDRFAEAPGVRFSAPSGAFYFFFSIDGLTSARDATFRLIDEAAVGLAPGTAFGEGGDGFLRMCFHRRLDDIETAADRVRDWLSGRESRAAVS